MNEAAKASIQAFFDAYARRFNNAPADPPVEDIEGTADAFAKFFVEASPDGENVQIPFEVVYFVQVKDETPRIFASITGDERGVLRQHGLLPPEA